MLSNTSCYLVGPVEHDPNFGKDWRVVVSEKLSEIGIKIYNPLNRPYWFSPIENYVPTKVSRSEVLDNIKNNNEKSKFVDAQKFIRKICIRYISTCDFVFCYLPNSKTFGTTEELVLASNSGKPIICVCPDDVPSLWIYDLLNDDYIFNNIDDAISYLYDINNNKIKVDALDWMFLPDSNKQKFTMFDGEKYEWS